jgi:hypothetical protein
MAKVITTNPRSTADFNIGGASWNSSDALSFGNVGSIAIDANPYSITTGVTTICAIDTYSKLGNVSFSRDAGLLTIGSIKAMGTTMTAGDISVNSGSINFTGSSVDLGMNSHSIQDSIIRVNTGSSTTKSIDTYSNLGSINFTGSSVDLGINAHSIQGSIIRVNTDPWAIQPVKCAHIDSAVDIGVFTNEGISANFACATKSIDTYSNLGSINFTGSSASLSIATATTITITGDIFRMASQLDSQASAAVAAHSEPFIAVERDANLVALGTIGQGLEIRIADGGSITYKDHVYNEGTYRVVGDNLLTTNEVNVARAEDAQVYAYADDPMEISAAGLGALALEPTVD